MPPGNVCQCLKTFLVVVMEIGVFFRHLSVEARDAARCLIVYMIEPHNQELQGPDVTGANIEKVWCIPKETVMWDLGIRDSK